MLEGRALGWSGVEVPFLPQLVLAGVHKSVQVVSLKLNILSYYDIC